MTTIFVDLPDGSAISYDRLRRQFLLTLRNGSLISPGEVPVRPNPPATTQINGQTVAVEEPKASEPVCKNVICRKLGYKKAPIIHTAIWNQRFVMLHSDHVTYHTHEGAAAKGTLDLKAGCTTQVIQAHEPARKDRFEDRDNQGSMAMMTAPIGSHNLVTGTPIGQANCVELHVPMNFENLMGGIMGASPMAMAFGGGLKKNMAANQARTYYFSFDSLAEAQSFCAALDNNIQCATQATPGMNSGQQPVNQSNFAGMNTLMNQTNVYKGNIGLMKDPEKSLEWYRSSLDSQLDRLVLYNYVILFYDQMRNAGFDV